MSSGVIVNGGTAESFAAEDGDCHVNYAPWEPEDLVATVQFLATLDERQMLPYVLPDDNRDSVVIVSQSEHDQVLGSVSGKSDPFNDFSLQVSSPLMTLPSSGCEEKDDPVHLDLVSESEPFIQQRSSPAESWIHDDHENMEVSASVSFTEDDNSQSVFDESHQHCYLTDTLATPSSESFISGSLTIRDVTDETSSAVQTPCSTEERSIIRTSNKPAHLKRVSFGNSKGSMVETLVYESPLTEEEPSPFGWKNSKMKNFRTCITSTPLPEETTSVSSEPGRSASKVRVTFFESERPLILTSPEASDVEWEDNMAEPPPQQQQPQHATYVRQISTESGQDNPFRPDGDLSREADELVELIKGGRPISEALKGKEEPHQEEAKVNEVHGAVDRDVKKASSPESETDGVIKSGANGSAPLEPEATRTPAPNLVEVQHGVVVPAADGSQVEHVVIKKKGKCQCCVIQ